MKTDKEWLEEARQVSLQSNDPSTKTGAIIIDDEGNVHSTGFNRFPIGLEEREDLMNNREAKYARILHSEVNAILDSKEDLTDCTIYIWPFLSCTNCAAMIIESGIKRVVAPKTPAHLEERWGDSFVIAREMYKEANVDATEIEI